MNGHVVIGSAIVGLLVGMTGAGGGPAVGLTSDGSGSLVIAMLTLVSPSPPARNRVGTDPAQAIPLTAAAALGALTFGSVQFSLTAAIIVGSVPAVLIGSMLSSRATDQWLRPVIFCVILASGLKYIGLQYVPLASTVGVAAALVGTDTLLTAARSRRSSAVSGPEPRHYPAGVTALQPQVTASG